jgi:hypothetical protein
MHRAPHLVGRFLRSLVPLPVRAREAAWVASVLTPAELGVWRRMGRADRRESIAVARRAERALRGHPGVRDARFVAAALLHDVGKVDARLGPLRRAGATLAGAVAGPAEVRSWTDRPGLARRVGLYLLHPEVGAAALAVAGARPEATAWARAHHDPAAFPALGFPGGVPEALAAADGEPAGPGGPGD